MKTGKNVRHFVGELCPTVLWYILTAEVVLIILMPIFFPSVHFKLMNYIILLKKRDILLDEYFLGDFIHQTYFSLYNIFTFRAWRLYVKSVTQLHGDCVYIKVI